MLCLAVCLILVDIQSYPSFWGCRKAFAPLVDAGFLAIVYGDVDVGTHLINHPLVDSVHLTGSAQTFDNIVWGPDNLKKVIPTCSCSFMASCDIGGAQGQTGLLHLGTGFLPKATSAFHSHIMCACECACLCLCVRACVGVAFVSFLDPVTGRAMAGMAAHVVGPDMAFKIMTLG